LLGLILINGLFVMSEIALVSARKARLESMANKGDELARRALELSNKPEVFLSAAQIGITLIAILTGVYSGERFSVYLIPFFKQISFLSDYAEGISITLVVIIVTFLSILFGELIPKRFGLLRAEKIAKLVAGPMYFFAKMTHPLVWLLNKISNAFFFVFNIKKSTDDAVTEEEIKAMVIESAEKFGLSQLHQLRGRVGRGADKSFCILLTGLQPTNVARQRIKIMCSTNDGFKIAEKDLELRGPGDIEGIRQSGVLNFKLASIVLDKQLLQVSKEMAERILDEDPDLVSAENLQLKQFLQSQKGKTAWSKIS